MTARKSSAKKQPTIPAPKLDHPDQAIDTPLPDDSINEEAFNALREVYEENPNKDEVPVDPEES